jgi:hypothetical protein
MKMGELIKYNGASWVERKAPLYRVWCWSVNFQPFQTYTHHIKRCYIFYLSLMLLTEASATINMDSVLKNITTNRMDCFIYFNDILAGTIYRLTYDIDFQLARPYSDEFNNKYKSE